MTKFQLGEKESQLLHSIYAAALVPEKWRAVIEAIVVHIGADSGQLIFSDPNYPERNLTETATSSACTAIGSGAILSSPAHLDLNEIKGLFNSWQEGVVILSQHFPLTTNALAPSANKDLITFDNVSAVIPLINSSNVASSLGFYSADAQYFLTAEALLFLQRLAPHISRALHIYNQVSAVKNTNISLIESLKCSNLGVLLLDDHLQVVYSTAEAGHILDKNPALQINRYNQLEIKDSRQQIHLDERLRRLLKGNCDGDDLRASEFTMPLRVPEKTHPLKLTAVILDKQEVVGTNKVRIAIFLNDPERQRLVPLDYLQQAFGLTRTEGAIAQLLLGGYSIGDVAQKRKTTVETARWQLKSILHKTNTANQAELTRLLMLLSHDVANKSLIIDQPTVHTTHLGDD